MGLGTRKQNVRHREAHHRRFLMFVWSALRGRQTKGAVLLWLGDMSSRFTNSNYPPETYLDLTTFYCIDIYALFILI